MAVSGVLAIGCSNGARTGDAADGGLDATSEASVDARGDTTANDVVNAEATTDAFASDTPSRDGGDAATTDGGVLPRCAFVDPCGASTGATVMVPSGGNLQATLDAANPGDTIVLQAGATYTGNFTLANKPGSACITVRTSTPDGTLPVRGARIAPSDAPMLARIVASGTAPAISTMDGAHNWRFLGI